jgi:RNA polymerase sigma-70 factor (ECF subfamily)
MNRPLLNGEKLNRPAGRSARPTDDYEEINSLARDAAIGDLNATRKLIEYVWPTVTQVVAGIMGTRHPETDDVVQQSLFLLVQALPAFRGECHAAGYASRIALHAALRARHRWRLRAMRTRVFALLAPDDVEGPSAGDAASANRHRMLLRDLLEKLPEEQADALGLRVLLGWSMDEIASATGSPVNTIRSRVRLAKEALRRMIEVDPVLANEFAGVK